MTKNFHDLTNYHNKSIFATLSSKFEHVSGGNYSEMRTIAKETYKKEKVVNVKQELWDNEWITINHMALPIVIFDYIQSFTFEKAMMKGAL